jgi:hypothetical protein
MNTINHYYKINKVRIEFYVLLSSLAICYVFEKLYNCCNIDFQRPIPYMLQGQDF